MTDNTKPQELINLLRTFIGDTQIVRAARGAADVIEQQAAKIAEMAIDLERTRNERNATYVKARREITLEYQALLRQKDEIFAQLSSVIEQRGARIAELEARSATPYCHIYEYDHGYFGLHRQFSPTEWNGMKPTRVVAVFTAPVADSAKLSTETVDNPVHSDNAAQKLDAEDSEAVSKAGYSLAPLDDKAKADRDLLLYGESFMLDGKHIPVDRIQMLRRTQRDACLSSMAKDSDRLDFLDAINTRKNAQYGTRYGWGLTENHNRIALEDHHFPVLTVREAIDAAIAASAAK